MFIAVIVFVVLPLGAVSSSGLVLNVVVLSADEV